MKKISRIGPAGRAWAFGPLLALGAAGAVAQTLPPAAVPRLPEVAPAPPAAAAPELRAPVRPALPPTSSLTVRVERFQLQGVSRLPEAQVQAVLAPFTGRTLGYAELSQAADAVTELYRREGWLLALAYLPEQTIRSGTVEIAVLEGRLGQLMLGQVDTPLDRAFFQALAGWRLAPGAVVGETNLVRNLLLMNDLPGVSVNAELRPGTTVGQADLTLDLRRSAPPLAGVVALDNQGSRFTGRGRLGATAQFVHLAGRGDQLDLQGVAAEQSGQFSLLASYQAPVHASGTRLGASASGLTYRIVAPELQALEAHGRAHTLALWLEQPVLRTPTLALALRGGVQHKQLVDRVDGVGQRDDRHIGALQLSLRGTWRPQGLDGAVTQWTLSAQHGHVDFDDAAAAALDASQLRTAGRFTKWNLDLSHRQPLTPSLDLLGRLWLQMADGNLDSAERAVIGGANALRAFGDRSASADEAAMASVELRWRADALRPGTVLSVFADAGEGRASRDPLPGAGSNRVRGATFGLGSEWALPEQFTLRVAVAGQNLSPRDPGTPAARWRGWLELVRAF